MQTSQTVPVATLDPVEDPIYAMLTTREALRHLEQSAMDCLKLVKQRHDAQKSAMRELRAVRRVLAPITKLAMLHPDERGPVVALLRMFIGATQWETRHAQQHAADTLPSLTLRMAAQVLLARLAICHEQEATRAQKRLAAPAKSAAKFTDIPARAPPVARRKHGR